MVSTVELFIRECVPKKVADMTVMILYTIKGNLLRRYCSGEKSAKEAAKLIGMAPCINAYLQPDDRCSMRFVNQTKQLVNVKDDWVKMPHICCNYVESMRCLDRQLNEHECLRRHHDYLMDLSRSFITSISDIMCGDYNEDTDRCDKLGPPPTPKTFNSKQYKTFIWVMTDILASMKTLTLAKFRAEQTGGDQQQQQQQV